MREDESALSCSQRSTPDRWAIRSIGTPEDHGTLIIDGERVYLGRLHKQKDAGEQFAKVKPVRKVVRISDDLAYKCNADCIADTIPNDKD